MKLLQKVGKISVGKIGKNSIVKSNNPNSRGLPFRGKPNSRYYGIDKTGKVEQVRDYNKNGTPKRDYDWNHAFRENGKSYPKGTPHSHEWNKDGTRSSYHEVIPQEKFNKMFPNIKDKEF